MSEPDLHCIVYVSTAPRVLSQAEMGDLLDEMRASQANHAVTGLLLYTGDHFLQVLEGSRDSVSRVFRSVESDPRHEHVMRLLDEPIECRAFSGCSMASHGLSSEQITGLPKIEEIVASGRGAEGLCENGVSQEIRHLVKRFRRLLPQGATAGEA